MKKFGAKEVMEVTLYDKSNGKPVIYFDTLKTSAIDVSSEKVYARGGRGNTKLITWEINKEAKFTCTDALLSSKSLELVSGIATIVGSQNIYMRQCTEYEDGIDKGDLYPLTASSTGVINLAYTPIESVDNIVIYEADDDCGTPIDMTGATLTDNVLTCSGASSKQVVVYYTFASSTDTETYIIDSTHFSGTYKMVGNTVLRNLKTGKDESFQLVIDNIKWSSDLKLDFSADGEPSPTSFDCEIMRASNNNQLIRMTQWKAPTA